MRRQLLALVVAVAALALAGGGCGSSAPDSQRRVEPPLIGAGSPENAPLLARWSGAYKRKTGTPVHYGVVGYGTEISRVGGALDFGAADAPLTPFQFSEAPATIANVPWAVSGMAIVYKLDRGPAGLRLNYRVLADILLRRIKAWNDPAIAALNPGAKLPGRKIVVVYRQDENGGDWALTDYLQANYPTFLRGVGTTRKLMVPGGHAAQGSKGVARTVAKTDGSIGYLSLQPALASGLDVALMENPAGKFTRPTQATLEEAARMGSRLGPNNEGSMAQLPKSAANAYPLAFYLYGIVPMESKRSHAMRNFLSYAISPAGQAAVRLTHLAPIPKRVAAADRETVAHILP